MRLEFSSRVICKVRRHFCKCPYCQSNIILDDFVFHDNPQNVKCNYCNAIMIVIKVIRTKDKFELEILDEPNKEIE